MTTTEHTAEDHTVGVPLKDAWARIEPHGRELRRMGAHSGAWTRTTAKGHAVAGAGFKAEMLRH